VHGDLPDEIGHLVLDHPRRPLAASTTLMPSRRAIG
jgi:hypothetical protein